MSNTMPARICSSVELFMLEETCEAMIYSAPTVGSGIHAPGSDMIR